MAAQYLLLERHYSTRMMALTGWLPFCATAIGAVLGGWFADAWIRRGGSAMLVRKSFCVTGLCGSAVLLLPSAVAAGQIKAMSLLILASFVFGLYYRKSFCCNPNSGRGCGGGQVDRNPERAGNLAGIVAPVVTGFIVERTGGFYLAFVWVCVLLLVGAFSFLLIIRRVAPVAWTNSTEDKNAFGAISSGSF